ncbi:hypothetical protein ACVSQB_42865, partial [Bradyrhizobium elkanii]
AAVSGRLRVPRIEAVRLPQSRPVRKGLNLFSSQPDGSISGILLVPSRLQGRAACKIFKRATLLCSNPSVVVRDFALTFAGLAFDREFGPHVPLHVFQLWAYRCQPVRRMLCTSPLCPWLLSVMRTPIALSPHARSNDQFASNLGIFFLPELWRHI